MGNKRYVGIDFGTSTSVIKVKSYDEFGAPVGQELSTQSVTFNNGASMVPTLVRELNGKYAFGFDAQTPQRHAQIYRAFKLGLQSEDPEKVRETKDLIGRFFEYLFKVYEHQRTNGFFGNIDDEDKTYVSFPVKWESATRDFMLDAAREAGFRNVEGMDEAEAAIQAITVQCREVLKPFLVEGKKSNIMLIDMGAGTTDVVICKYTPVKRSTPDKKNRIEILTTWPRGGDVFFGGQTIDNELKDFIVSKFPEQYREQVRKRISVDSMKAWKENNVSPALRNRDTVRDCNEADTVAYWLEINYDDLTLNRDSFEKLFESYISQFVRLVGEAIMDSGLTPEDIDLVVLTGGHSRWYFIEDILNGTTTKFGDLNLTKIRKEPNRILSVALPQETVALGLVYSPLAGKVVTNPADQLWKSYLATGSINTLMEAAQAGSADAQNDLAFRFRWADGVPKNTEESDRLFRLAAAQGHKLALYNLGCQLFQQKEYKQALEYFRKAAAKSVPEANNNIAVCYHYGLGVQQDNKKALEYFKKAFDLGYTPAKKSYSELYQELTGLPGDMIDTDDVVEYALKINSINAHCYYIGESQIPTQKLNNFLSNFNGCNLNGQKLISYFDDTWFGSGKTGFLLTDKKLYWKTMWNPARECATSDIEKVFINNSNKLVVSVKKGFSDWIPSGIYTANLEAFFAKILDFLFNNN